MNIIYDYTIPEPKLGDPVYEVTAAEITQALAIARGIVGPFDQTVLEALDSMGIKPARVYDGGAK